jgi:hypothetical protein
LPEEDGPVSSPPVRTLPLTPLEDATLRYVLSHAHEGDGWLDLTRICSQTGRMLPEVRDAILRLARRRLILLDEKAKHTPRWMRFSLPIEPEQPADREPVA